MADAIEIKSRGTDESAQVTSGNVHVDVKSNSPLAAGEAVIGLVGAKFVQKSTSFTRPSDTTAYAAGDAISNSTSSPSAFQISGLARANGGRVFITNIKVTTSANQSTPASLLLFLFKINPTRNNDNAAYAPIDNDLETNLIKVIPLSLSNPGNRTSGAGGNRVYDAEIAHGFVCTANDDSVYPQLVVDNAYTPVSAEKFLIEIGAFQL